MFFAVRSRVSRLMQTGKRNKSFMAAQVQCGNILLHKSSFKAPLLSLLLTRAGVICEHSRHFLLKYMDLRNACLGIAMNHGCTWSVRAQARRANWGKKTIKPKTTMCFSVGLQIVKGVSVSVQLPLHKHLKHSIMEHIVKMAVAAPPKHNVLALMPHRTVSAFVKMCPQTSNVTQSIFYTTAVIQTVSLSFSC